MKESMEKMFSVMDEYMAKMAADCMIKGDIPEEVRKEMLKNQEESAKIYRVFRKECVELAKIEDERFNKIMDRFDTIEKKLDKKVKE